MTAIKIKVISEFLFPFISLSYCFFEVKMYFLQWYKSDCPCFIFRAFIVLYFSAIAGNCDQFLSDSFQVPAGDKYKLHEGTRIPSSRPEVSHMISDN